MQNVEYCDELVQFLDQNTFCRYTPSLSNEIKSNRNDLRKIQEGRILPRHIEGKGKHRKFERGTYRAYVAIAKAKYLAYESQPTNLFSDFCGPGTPGNCIRPTGHIEVKVLLRIVTRASIWTVAVALMLFVDGTTAMLYVNVSICKLIRGTPGCIFNFTDCLSALGMTLNWAPGCR